MTKQDSAGFIPPASDIQVGSADGVAQFVPPHSDLAVGQIDQAPATQPAPQPTGSFFGDVGRAALGEFTHPIQTLRNVGAAISPELLGPQGPELRQQAVNELMGEAPAVVRPVVTGVAKTLLPKAALLLRGISPDTAQGLENLVSSTEQGFQQTNPGVVGKVAEVGTNVLTELPFIANPATAPTMLAAGGVEAAIAQNQAENERRAKAGLPQTSVLQDITNIGGQAAINYLFGKLLPGQKVNAAIIKRFAPELAQAASGAIRRTLLQGGIQATEGMVMQLASNSIQQLAGHPTELTQGVPEAGLTQGLTGAALHTVQELQGKGAPPIQPETKPQDAKTAVVPATEPQPSPVLTDFLVKSREGANKGQEIQFPSMEEKAKYISENKGYRGPIVQEANKYLADLEAFRKANPTPPAPEQPAQPTNPNEPDFSKATFENPPRPEKVLTDLELHDLQSRLEGRTTQAPPSTEPAKPIHELTFGDVNVARTIAEERARNTGKSHFLMKDENGQYHVDQRNVGGGIEVLPTGQYRAAPEPAAFTGPEKRGVTVEHAPLPQSKNEEANARMRGRQAYKTIEYVPPRTAEHAGFAKALKDLGRRVIFFKNGSAPGSGGFAIREHPDTIYINDGANGAQLADFMTHELFHTVQNEHPDLANETHNLWTPAEHEAAAKRYETNAMGAGRPDIYELMQNPDTRARESGAMLVGEAARNPEVVKGWTEPQKTWLGKIIDKFLEFFGKKPKLTPFEQKVKTQFEKIRTRLEETAKSKAAAKAAAEPQVPTHYDVEKKPSEVSNALTGKGTVYDEEIKPKLKKFSEMFGEIKDGFRKTYNPGGSDISAAETKGIAREQMAKFDLAQRKAEAAFEQARKGFEKLPQDEQWAFQERMDNGTPQPTPELEALAKELYADTRKGRDKLASLGVEAAKGWQDEWWNRLWKKDPAQAARMMDKFGRAGKIEGKAGFLKSRSIEDWADALKQGLVPKYDNPIDMFLATKAERNRYIGGLNTMHEMDKQGMFVRFKGVIPDGWTEVPQAAKGPLKNVVPGDGKLAAPTPVAEVLTNITSHSAVGNKAAFRLLSEVNSTLTQAALGFSGFHLFKVATEGVAAQVGRAVEQATKGEFKEAGKTALRSILAPFEAPIKGRLIQKKLLGQVPSTPQEQAVFDGMLKGGQRVMEDTAWKSQWRRRFSKAINDGGVNGWIRAALNAPFALNEAIMQKIIFDYVQTSKLYHGFEQTSDVLRRLGPNADPFKIREEAAKVSDHLDNVFGLMVRDNLFWNRTARDLATLSMLSVGWNYGAKRSLTRGLYEFAKAPIELMGGKDPKKIDTRSAAYIASVATAQAIAGAVITYMATGKGPQSLVDYVFPNTGKTDKNGHAVRLRLPFYTGDWYDFLTDPVNTLKHKASPIIHILGDLYTNKDYYGTQIRQQDDKWYQQAWDVAKYLGEQTKPFSVKQLQDTIAGKGTAANTGMEALPFIGVRFAAKKHSYSTAEEKFHEIMSQQQEVGGRTRANADRSALMADLADDVRNKVPNAGQRIRDALSAGQIVQADVQHIREIARSQPGLAGQIQRSSLDPRSVMQVWDRMSKEERVAAGPIVITKVRGSTVITPEQKQALLKQLIAEWQKAKGGQ